MAQVPITPPIQVISHTADPSSGKLLGGPGGTDVDAKSGFAHTLATQIGLTDLPTALVEENKAEQIQLHITQTQPAIEVLSHLPEDSKSWVATLAELPLPHLMVVAQNALHQARSADASLTTLTSKLAPVLSEQAPVLLDRVALTAKAATETAKFAATEEKFLPKHAESNGVAETVRVVSAAGTPIARTDIVIQHPAPTNAPVTVSVPGHVGQPGWDTALGQKVAWIATNHQQVAQLQVTPPNLGPIEIRITIANDQASAIFVSPHAAVRDAIESALPRLREMLADNGLSLGNVNVSSQSFQQSQQQTGQGKPGSGPTAAGYGLDANAVVEGEGTLYLPHRSRGLVDIFA